MTLASVYQLLCADHLQAQGIVDTIDEPVVLLDNKLSVVKANPAFLKNFQVAPTDTLGVSLFDLGNGQWDIPELRRLLADVIPKAQAIVGFEVTHDFPTLGARTMLVSARRLVQPEGDDDAILFVAFTDVTEARKRGEAADLLLAEARHRIKNTMAIVHSIAYQTPAKGRSGEEYRDAYLSRLDAFLSTEDLIHRSGDAGVTVSALVQDALHAVAPDRIDIQPGPPVYLARQQVRPLRMILHELTTNAFKYGSLSRPEGVVRVAWERTGDNERPSVRLDWQEEQGPPVTPPVALGFGVTMIERTATNIGGRADIRFDPEGLQVALFLPILQADSG